MISFTVQEKEIIQQWLNGSKDYIVKSEIGFLAEPFLAGSDGTSDIGINALSNYSSSDSFEYIEVFQVRYKVYGLSLDLKFRAPSLRFVFPNFAEYLLRYPKNRMRFFLQILLTPVGAGSSICLFRSGMYKIKSHKIIQETANSQGADAEIEAVPWVYQINYKIPWQPAEPVGTIFDFGYPLIDAFARMADTIKLINSRYNPEITFNTTFRLPVYIQDWSGSGYSADTDLNRDESIVVSRPLEKTFLSYLSCKMLSKGKLLIPEVFDHFVLPKDYPIITFSSIGFDLTRYNQTYIPELNDFVSYDVPLPKDAHYSYDCSYVSKVSEPYYITKSTEIPAEIQSFIGSSDGFSTVVRGVTLPEGSLTELGAMRGIKNQIYFEESGEIRQTPVPSNSSVVFYMLLGKKIGSSTWTSLREQFRMNVEGGEIDLTGSAYGLSDSLVAYHIRSFDSSKTQIHSPYDDARIIDVDLSGLEISVRPTDYSQLTPNDWSSNIYDFQNASRVVEFEAEWRPWINVGDVIRVAYIDEFSYENRVYAQVLSIDSNFDSLTARYEVGLFFAYDLFTFTMVDSVYQVAPRSGVTMPKSLIIPDSYRGVDVVYCTGFDRRSDIEKIQIFPKIQIIGSEAFYGLTELTEIVIGEGVTTLETSAIDVCPKLASVIFRSSTALKTISSWAIASAYALSKLEIPRSVDYIGVGAFGYLSSLTEISIPFVGENRDGTGNNFFGHIFGSTSKTAGSNFSGAPGALTKVIVQTGDIPDYGFYTWVSLTRIFLSNTCENIGKLAFQHCDSLLSMFIPNSLTSIGKNAFQFCRALQTFTFNSFQNSQLTDIGWGAFMDCWNLTSFTMPFNVERVGGRAFANCSRLTRVNWYSIACEEAGGSGYPIFENCGALTDVYIGNRTISIPPYAFFACGSMTNLTFNATSRCTSIGAYAFERCSGLTSVTIPDSVTSIGNGAFSYCSDITNIVLGRGIINIGEAAFSNCIGLTSITIPNGVTSIGEAAFWNCEALMSITYNGTKAQWQAISKGLDWNYEVPATVVHCTDGDVAI